MRELFGAFLYIQADYSGPKVLWSFQVVIDDHYVIQMPFVIHCQWTPFFE